MFGSVRWGENPAYVVLLQQGAWRNCWPCRATYETIVLSRALETALLPSGFNLYGETNGANRTPGRQPRARSDLRPPAFRPTLSEFTAMTKRSRLLSIALVSGLVMAAAAWAADYNTAVKQTPLMSWTGRSPAPELANEDPVAVAKQVDRLLIEDIATADSGTKVIQPSRRASDEVFLRRVYLDLIGRNPTPDEVTAFVLDPRVRQARQAGRSPARRSALRRKLGPLLARRDHVSPQRRSGSARLAEPLYEYLREQFNKNTPWDRDRPLVHHRHRRRARERRHRADHGPERQHGRHHVRSLADFPGRANSVRQLPRS